MSNIKFFTPVEWVPDKDIGHLSLREQLHHHVHSVGEVATTMDDMRDVATSANLSVREAVEASVWLKEGSDPTFREALHEGDI